MDFRYSGNICFVQRKTRNELLRCGSFCNDKPEERVALATGLRCVKETSKIPAAQPVQEKMCEASRVLSNLSAHGLNS